MPLQICSIASGSNGNCYYVGNENEAVLVDAGISCRTIEKRMQRKGLDIKKVKALFISHEHTDHIYGMKTLSKKHQVPVFITSSTLKNSYAKIEKHLVYSFREADPVCIGGLAITPFRKSHDAADPHSFVISGNNVNVGVFTDIGHACEPLINYFSQCHAAFLETNYCEEMLMNGDYPVFLKKRINGDDGHLSNAQALQLFLNHRGPHLGHLILSHLSQNNNDPALVNRVFLEQASSTKIVVASRYEETEVIDVDSDISLSPLRHVSTGPLQLSLFGAL